MSMHKTKLAYRNARKTRIRKRIIGVAGRPRLSVYRSNKYTYAQIIDDATGKTLVSVSDHSIKAPEKKKSEIAVLIGEEIAKKAKEQKLTAVVFDRGGYRYHGRVKAVADGARKGGLEF